jgi:hypothetical protein
MKKEINAEEKRVTRVDLNQINRDMDQINIAQLVQVRK